MRNFAYAKAPDLDTAVRAGAEPDTAYLAGGTELVNWLKFGVARPARVLDIADLDELAGVSTTGDGLTIGALARLNDIALHPVVARDYPVLSQAILKAASAQLRNLATIGGNLLQRTRCPYFRAEVVLPCNKRTPGSGCAARDGDNRNHAIFGWSDACVATHPADPPVALAALDAMVQVRSRAGSRTIPAVDFHRLPGDQPEVDTMLQPGELITAIEVPAQPSTRQSAYVKVRERESYEFATVAAAVTLDLDGGRIRAARIALGSVAHKPWRLAAAEQRLRGVPCESAAMRDALGDAFAEARPLAHNAYKIELARNAVLRALEQAGGLLA
jgi:xanthine dehydrogenase YagS FAD-binding subunit